MKNLILKSLLIVACFIVIASCNQKITFNPDFYVGDHVTGGIVDEKGEEIFASDARFDGFGCLSVDKIKELEQILLTSKIGMNKSDKIKIQKEYLKFSNRIHQ